MLKKHKSISSARTETKWATLPDLSEMQYQFHKNKASHEQKDDLISDLLKNAVGNLYVIGANFKTIQAWSRGVSWCSQFTEPQCSLFQYVTQIPGVIKLFARHRNQKVEIWVISENFDGGIQDAISLLVLKHYDAYKEDIDVVYAGVQDIDFELLPDFEIDF